MMTRKYKLTLTVLLLFFSSRLFCATSQTAWIIGAEKFSYTRNQTGSVADGIAVMFPARILEKLSSNMYRSVKIDEKAERELYKLRQEKKSLFLQLSSEVKKRDSLFLEKYSNAELNRKIADEEKKIQDLKTKLSENLKRQKELEADATQQIVLEQEASERKGIFNSTVNSDSEKISLYKNDISALFSPSQSAQESGLKSAVFEKEVVNAKINCLLTGAITAYEEYMSVTVEAVIFPGAKVAATITEIGSIDDADLIASNIVRELAPVITNSMPVTIQITVAQSTGTENLKTYIDDILYSSIENSFTIDSGVHFIQFTAEGYKNAGTNYYFEGNKFYNIEVTLEPLEEKTIYVVAKNNIAGDFLINGIPSEKLPDGKSKIVINGNAVLGEFITEENTSAFIYVPPKKLADGALYTSKLKPLDHSEYIEKYRRRMYLSYSVLVTSLVPTIAVTGRLKNYVSLFNDTARTTELQNQGLFDEKYKEAQIWNTTALVCTGISIAAGAWFIFELYRYFHAANSVLPANTKIDFSYEEPESTEEPENTTE